MGTISDKLTYLNTTKTMLRDSLNKFGSNILTTDTFRSYDTKLNEIYDKLPKVTGSGSEFTLTPVQNGQVDDFKMIGTDLEQNTTTGKQLLNIPDGTYSSNGVTAVAKDGIVTLNGTAGNGNSFIKIPFIFNFEDTKTYTLSANNEDVIGGSSYDVSYSSIRFNLSDEDGGNSSIQTWCYLGTKNNSKTINMNYNAAKFCIRTGEGLTYNNFVIKPQLEEGSSSTSFEPYTGGIPSPNPDYPQDIKVVEGRQVITDKGKNLFDKNNVTLGYRLTTEGRGTPENDYYVAQFIKVKPNTIYTKNSPIEDAYHRFAFYSSNSTDDFISVSNSNTVTTPSNCNYIRFCGLQSELNETQLEEGSSSTNFEPYYEPVSYNIDLQLANIYLAKIPNTDYKNRVYKNNGNWYFEENVKKIVLDGSEDENWTNYSKTMILTIPREHTFIILCDYFKPTSDSTWQSNNDSYKGMCSSLNTVGQIKFMPLEDMTLNEFKTWLSTNNVDVWCQLDNPITTQITNTTLINQLEAISVHTGTNIITISNDNNIIPEIEITRLKELEKLV